MKLAVLPSLLASILLFANQIACAPGRLMTTFPRSGCSGAKLGLSISATPLPPSPAQCTAVNQQFLSTTILANVNSIPRLSVSTEYFVGVTYGSHVGTSPCSTKVVRIEFLTLNKCVSGPSVGLSRKATCLSDGSKCTLTTWRASTSCSGSTDLNAVEFKTDQSCDTGANLKAMKVKTDSKGAFSGQTRTDLLGYLGNLGMTM